MEADLPWTGKADAWGVQIVSNALALPSVPVALKSLPVENWNVHHPFVNLFAAASQIAGAFWCSAWIASHSSECEAFPNKILVFLVLLILGRCEERLP